MGPTWDRQDPGGPHVGPMNIAIWVCFSGALQTFPVTLHFVAMRCWMVLPRPSRITSHQHHFSHPHSQGLLYWNGGNQIIALVTEKKGHQIDNIVVIGGTVSCHNDNLRCHQWWQCCQFDNLLFSVVPRKQSWWIWVLNSEMKKDHWNSFPTETRK